MPNFGDFNFNDDADSVDTDPTNDNVGPEIESSSDGIQNDKTNYHEPGQGEQFTGGDFSQFTNNTNPEEPGAQQDEIPPITVDPVGSTSAKKKAARTSFRNIIDPDENDYFYQNPVDDYLDTVVSSLTGKKKLTSRFSSRFAGRIDKVIDQWEKDNGIFHERPRTIKDFFNTLHDSSLWTENLLDYFTESERKNKAKELGISLEELEESGYQTNYEELANFFDAYNDSSAWSTDSFGTGNWADSLKRLFVNIRSDKLLAETIDIVSDSSVIESLLANISVEDDLAIIVDTDDAESTNNPTGIGEMFDRPIIDGPDDDFSMIEILVAQPFTEINELGDLEGMDGLDFLNLIEATMGYDLNSYMGDLIQNSDLIEFQNLGDSALENFDGLL